MKRGEYYAIRPMLPELSEDSDEEEGCLAKPYSSKDSLLTLEEVGELLKSHRLLVDDAQPDEGEMLR